MLTTDVYLALLEADRIKEEWISLGDRAGWIPGIIKGWILAIKEALIWTCVVVLITGWICGEVLILVWIAEVDLIREECLIREEGLIHEVRLIHEPEVLEDQDKIHGEWIQEDVRIHEAWTHEEEWIPVVVWIHETWDDLTLGVTREECNLVRGLLPLQPDPLADHQQCLCHQQLQVWEEGLLMTKRRQPSLCRSYSCPINRLPCCRLTSDRVFSF